MICRHFGRKVSLSRIRQLCHTSTDGTSLKAICRAATELGLAARALKVSLRNLPLMPLPAIIHWEGNHWMVLYDVADTYVKVADPALGLRKIPRKEFEQNWSGYAALFDYTVAFANAPESKPGLAWILPFLTKFRTLFLQVMLLAVAITFLELLFPDLHRNGGRQGDRRERHQPAQNHSPRDGRGALFRPGGVARAGISALVCRRSPRHRDPRLPEPANVVAADELFHQPPHGRHPAPARWRAAGATIHRAARHRRAPRAGPARRRDLAHGALQPVTHARFPRDHAALRRADVFLAKGAAPALRRGRREPGQIQFTPDRCNQRHRSGQGFAQRKTSFAT